MSNVFAAEEIHDTHKIAMVSTHWNRDNYTKLVPLALKGPAAVLLSVSATLAVAFSAPRRRSLPRPTCYHRTPPHSP